MWRWLGELLGLFYETDRKALSRIEEKIAKLLKIGENLMAKMDDLIIAVSEQTTVIASAGALLDGLSAEIADLRADLVTAGLDTAKIDEVLMKLAENKQALQDAVVRNTPAAE